MPSLPPGFSRETAIRRDAHGRWFDGETQIENESIVRAFDRWIDRAPDGRYCLKNEVNWAYVEIEGPPIFVRDSEITEDEITLHLSDERTEPLDSATLWMDADGYLFCSVRDGTMTAQFTRRASFRLEPILDEDEEGIFLRVGREIVRPEIRVRGESLR